MGQIVHFFSTKRKSTTAKVENSRNRYINMLLGNIEVSPRRNLCYRREQMIAPGKHAIAGGGGEMFAPGKEGSGCLVVADC